MSYSLFGFGGTEQDPNCIYFMAPYGEKGHETYMPEDLCPVDPTKSGYGKARICGGGEAIGLHQMLNWMGLYFGEINTGFNQESKKAVQSIADKYGLKWDGTDWGIKKDLCKAIIYEAKKTVESCKNQKERSSQPCWANLTDPSVPSSPPFMKSEPSEKKPTSPPKKNPPSSGSSPKAPPKNSPGKPSSNSEGWWDNLDDWKKYGLIGGGAALVLGVVYVATR